MLHGKQLAGTGKAGLHFVGNQQNTVGIAKLAQRLHKISRGNIKATFALHWFNDNRRHLIRGDIGFENMSQAFERHLGGHTVRGIWIETVIHRTRERAEADFVRCDFAGQRHGHKRTTMEATAEGNQSRTFGIGAGNFHRVLNRFRPSAEKRRFGVSGNRHGGINTFC